MKDYIRRHAQSRAKLDRRTKRQTRRLCRKNRPLMIGLLEDKAGEGAKEIIEDTLEAERDDFLGRGPNEPTQDKTAFRGYRNGYYTRTVGLGCGPVKIDMPKVTNGPELFESQVLPPYLRTSPKVLETLPQLYLHGLSGGDFRPALSAMLGEKAVLSNSSIARLCAKWHQEYIQWHQEPLESHYAYLYADGIFLRVGQAPDKLALLVVIGVDSEGRKRLLAMLPGYRESYENWLDVFRNLVERGVKWAGLVIADGIASLWRVVSEVFPHAGRQWDWVHRMKNILEKLPQDKQFHERAHQDLLKIYNARTRQEAYHWMERFAQKYAVHPEAVSRLIKKRKELTVYFDFPKEHWVHLKTSNPIESSFSAIRTRLIKAKRIVLESSATGLVFQLMLKRQARWQRLHCPVLAALVIAGVTFRNGVALKPVTRTA